ncbi:hypothetical protein OO014_02210 [Intrasporangium calvum]|uniref:Copper type II ascorbate-dependent monooxygenase C-terminal domain-containing protein n=1 Tax=Intrasporangium calvum TaxID=53358 RepID=A0ABT5GE17_9MICO|nr:hypothetical protein [Intrasporangium calvum]MDC5696055.1 hypothetical protein [Intrasporangium calvum]
MRKGRFLVALGAALGILGAGCAGGEPDQAAPERLDAPSTSPTTAASPEPARAALRAGERVKRVGMPADYVPRAPGGATDDYRCFLLDPEVRRDSFVTGYDVVPGDVSVVHHVILYRVPADKVNLARAQDAETPGDGWTCFGGTGIEQQGASLDDAPWVGAWAPGGAERLLDEDLGIPLDKGSQLVLQVHYNLLHGAKPDRTAVDLRLSTSPRLSALETVLYPAPVELPCRAGRSGPLCDREAAVWDVAKRFGKRAGQTVAGLQLLCQGSFEADPGPTQSCTRTVKESATIRSAAGHMHLLGSSIRIELNAGTAGARTLLDIGEWDFDDQSARRVRATKIRPGDRITVTCTHDQAWRDRLPALQGTPERYVVWGEGTTDEMCLGILGVTRS